MSATCTCGRPIELVDMSKGPFARLPAGWWIAPFSTGAIYTCPPCGKR